MDGIKSHLTPSERQEIFRQFKYALRVKSNTVRNTSRLYEWQLRRLQSGQRGIIGASGASQVASSLVKKSDSRE